MLANAAPGAFAGVASASELASAAGDVQKLESGGGSNLPAAVQARAAASLGVDVSPVQMHENSAVAKMGAKAVSDGQNVHFAPGAFQPDTRSGQQLIGHELAHVVQASEGRVGETGRRGGPGGESLSVNQSPGLEREADRGGQAFANNPIQGLSDRMPDVAAISLRSSPLQFAFDKNTPSTYDDDGGHSYADHGAQTTANDHLTRLTTGACPSGRNSVPPDGKSSKFASKAMHIAAVKMALEDLKDKKKKRNGDWKKGYSNHYVLANVGITYELDGEKIKDPTTKCSNFYCAWSNDGLGDNFKLITCWPKP